ncbi:MAG TPA: DMT family transporter [Methylomirabilota bacterium]|nr:DMT family transporter [Methylomirabilota bacterium]
MVGNRFGSRDFRAKHHPLWAGRRPIARPCAMSATTSDLNLRSSPGKGVVYMLAASGTLTIMDAGIKWLTDSYPVSQIGFMRYAVGVVVPLGFALRLGGLGSLRTRRPVGHALRSLFNIGTMLTFYYALKQLPLADTVAIGYGAPLFMTALSVPLLKEHVGWRRWSAVIVGFLGVVVVLRPTMAGISEGALWALAAALLYALTLVTSRQLSATESSHTILFYYSFFVIVALGALMPFVWVTPKLGDLWLIVFVGLSGSFGQFFLNQAFRYGEVSMLAPLDYTGLLWATMLGIVVWGDIPTAWVLVGSAIIIMAGMYIVRREAMLRRAARRAAAASTTPRDI